MFVLYKNSFYKIRKNLYLMTIKFYLPNYNTYLKKNKLPKIVEKYYALFSFIKLPITFERNFKFANLINFSYFVIVSWIVWTRH